MSDTNTIDANLSALRGGRSSVIEHFGIRGLYGYRSISLSSEFAATILIARNGTGKTTLLGALDAFLHRQFLRLRGLEFKEIVCKFRGEEELVITRGDIELLLDIPNSGELIKVAAQVGVAPPILFSFLMEEWPTIRDSRQTPFGESTFDKIFQSVGYTYSKMEELANRLLHDLLARAPNVASVSAVIERVLRGFDIVYLPTYRRVELALQGEPEPHSRRRKKPKFNVAAGSLFTGEIQFGLSDISERLSEMNSVIVNQSNSGYREISANIINELLDGSFERKQDTSNVPSREELKLFFDRLEGGRRHYPYYPVATPDFDRLYGNSVSPGSEKFLNYFLNQLGIVIEATRDIERSVQDFISNCNKYLRSEEQTTSRGRPSLIGGKELRLNRQNLSVDVESVPSGRRIALDALSSGEKQMISLFAKMFLYDGDKIVLIDEPELSLSIDWQREILVDVLGAPLCRQVIAITHSPFVFDNDLEPFARALTLSDVE